jgi:uncharacterized membrane protein YqaE (UPF0057 family)
MFRPFLLWLLLLLLPPLGVRCSPRAIALPPVSSSGVKGICASVE